MELGIWISQEVFQGLAPEFQDELLTRLRGKQTATAGRPPLAPALREGGDEEAEDQPADFSLAQIKKLLEGCGEKTKSALRLIAEHEGNAFNLKELAGAMGLDPMGLRGVWGGITKRTKTVLGDTEAYFISWEENEDSWVGNLSDMTHKNLRKALGL